jgi:hypothetical protein
MTDTGPSGTAAEDLNLGAAPRHIEPAQGKTAFERWHHPRKQFVRIKQWCSQARALIRELRLPKGATFNYLTLPGDEMLDIRALNGVCEREAVLLKYLGFNNVAPGTAGQAELLLSHSEVRDLPGVDRFSTVLEEKLEAIGRTDSLAHHQMRQYGPFHAINIDLCDSLTHHDIDDRRGSSLSVLAELLRTQLTTTTPWLLFLTTLAQPGLVSPRNLQGFQDAISANVEASPDFATELARLVSGNAEELDARLETAWRQQDPDFLRLFCAGLGKWLLAILCGSAPKRSLQLLSSYYYRVGPDGPDMLSLAFRCDTAAQVLVDPAGILPPAEVPDPFSEVQLAIALARELHNTADLDQMIADDGELADKLLKQAMRLMGSARFSTDAYEEWALEELRKHRVILGREPAAA